jgi:hypothetical protein
MSFGETYGNILSPFIQDFKTGKNLKERKTVLKNAADALLKSRETLEDAQDDLPNDLQAVSKSFFSPLL